MSPTDMVISTGSTMIRDTISQSPQHSLETDGRQGRAPVVAITKEVLNGDVDMGRMNVSHCGSCTKLLELIIFPQGQITGQEHGICHVTVRVLS